MRDLLPRFSAAVIVLSLAMPTAAFAPKHQTNPLIGQGPTDRIYVETPEIQAALAQQPAYQDFLGRYGGQWEAQFDELLGTPVWIRGSGVQLIPDYQNATADQVEAISRDFVAANRQLFKVDPSELVLTDVGFSDHVWVVYFQRHENGVPVLKSNIELVYKFGRLILMYGESYPSTQALASTRLLSAAPAPAVPVQDARQIAARLLQLPAAPEIDEARQVIMPLLGEGSVDYRLAWEVHNRREGSDAYDYTVFVDALRGEILEAWDNHKYAYGKVSVQTNQRTPVDPKVVGPMLYGDVQVGSTTLNTGGNGFWVADLIRATDILVYLRGDHVRVSNSAGADMVIGGSASPGNPWFGTFYASTEQQLAQTQIYRATNTTNRMVRRVVTNNNWLNNNQITGRANLNSTCNAYYSGSINFYRSGSGCSNTGQIFDVVAHEYGHGVDANLPGGAQSGGLGEFIGDLMSVLQTGSPEVGPFFFTTGGPVRDLEPGPSNMRCYNQGIWGSHDQGQMLGIVNYDIIQALKAAGIGELRLAQVMIGPISTSQSLTSWYNGLLVADDDDGNLANGTPHGCIIWTEFDEHSAGGSYCGSGSFSRWPGVPTNPVSCTGG